ncbi:hypothetical protein ACNQ62_01255 [Sulfitobacter sp. SBS6]|uniref:hypothetical protein n=1 Tax=Sulfitobacter sp. SBS6 TaxID=3401755 RepID=UPI003AB07661
MKIAILKSFPSAMGREMHLDYVSAAIDLEIEYEIIDLLGDNWEEIISRSCADVFVHRPPDKFQTAKNIHDERIYFIEHIFRKNVSPSYIETLSYENKRVMDALLKSYNLPKVRSIVATNTNMSQQFREKNVPFVCKSNIGSAGSGVSVFRKNNLWQSVLDWLVFGASKFPAIGWTRFGKFRGLIIPAWWYQQRNYRILQQYSSLKWEWRVVVIGDTLSAHQKLLAKGKASGSNLVGWVEPPNEVVTLALDFIKKSGFFAAAIDIFETEDGDLLINEIQSVYMSRVHYQMKFDGKSGIYRLGESGIIRFEEGSHHEFSGFKLRLAELRDRFDENGIACDDS